MGGKLQLLRDVMLKQRCTTQPRTYREAIRFQQVLILGLTSNGP